MAKNSIWDMDLHFRQSRCQWKNLKEMSSTTCDVISNSARNGCTPWLKSQKNPFLSDEISPLSDIRSRWFQFLSIQNEDMKKIWPFSKLVTDARTSLSKSPKKPLTVAFVFPSSANCGWHHPHYYIQNSKSGWSLLVSASAARGGKSWYQWSNR